MWARTCESCGSPFFRAVFLFFFLCILNAKKSCSDAGALLDLELLPFFHGVSKPVLQISLTFFFDNLFRLCVDVNWEVLNWLLLALEKASLERIELRFGSLGILIDHSLSKRFVVKYFRLKLSK